MCNSFFGGSFNQSTQNIISHNTKRINNSGSEEIATGKNYDHVLLGKHEHVLVTQPAAKKQEYSVPPV